MLKSRAVLVSAAFLVTLTGCGLSGTAHITQSPSKSQDYTVSGQVSTTPSTTPSGATSTSSSPSTPASTTTSTPSSSTGSSQSSSTSPWNPVVASAMNDLVNSSDLPLAAPTVVPPPPGPGYGYLTALVIQNATSWSVRLIDTSIPLNVNSTNIQQHLIAGAPYVGSFGINLLSQSELVNTAPERSSVLRTNNALWAASDASAKATASQKVTVGSGGDALVATAYAFNGSYNSAKLVWTEGDWTIEIVNASPRYEQAMALSVVNYLHTHYLPPYPGLIMIDMINNASAVTRIDWINGDQLILMDDRQATPNNPVNTCSMAVHWTPYH
ncbi:MAG: hypothetical protein C7B46_06520 [Sulfobacillus benefaciens]|uniref:Uncharacterized protein n=1 Tax=Sulfobacillus benefaciens TaxID=453960 RepID=A0A2T2XI83_9FIRM|nr:MAG: hypothetical protein C7B46_06520 [Sulfobacillus benefaciens]